MRNYTSVLSRREFVRGLTFALPLLNATAQQASASRYAPEPLALAVTVSPESSASFYKSLVVQHANKVLPTGICEPIVNRIQSSAVYSNTALKQTFHDQFRSSFIIETAVAPVRTRDSQVYYAIERFVLLDDMIPRAFKDLNRLEMETFLLERWSAEGILSPCNERRVHYYDDDKEHLYRTARLHGYSSNDIVPLYCRPVRRPSKPSSRSTLAHAVKLPGIRDQAGQPKLSILISPNDI